MNLKQRKKRIVMSRVTAVEDTSTVRFLAKAEVRVLRSLLQWEKVKGVDKVMLVQTKVRCRLKEKQAREDGCGKHKCLYIPSPIGKFCSLHVEKCTISKKIHWSHCISIFN